MVFGQTQVSGIKFFLWDNQFGRFFNTGPIQNHNGHPLYFVLAFLWTFLPWTVVFMAAMVAGMRKFPKNGTDEKLSFVFLCGAFFVTFLLFSVTNFQLDHYTVILFPFAAILCGKFLADWLVQPSNGRALLIEQLCITLLLVGLAIGLSVYVGNPIVLIVVLSMLIAFLAYGYVMRKHLHTCVVLVYPIFGITILYAFLVLTTALTFTSHSVAYNANTLLAGRPGATVYVFQMDIVARELSLYRGWPCIAIDNAAQLPIDGKRYYLIARAEQLDSLQEKFSQVEHVAQGHWVVHKTGTLPRLLRLAKGTEPLEDISIVQVQGMK